MRNERYETIDYVKIHMQAQRLRSEYTRTLFARLWRKIGGKPTAATPSSAAAA